MIEFADMPTHKFNYNEAWLYCLTLVHNQHKDWRMPTEDEYMEYHKIVSESFDEGDDPTDIMTRAYIVPVRDAS